MKKEVPFTSKIEVFYDWSSLEGILLSRFNRIIEENFTFSEYDLNLFCAIIIRKGGLENLPQPFKNYTIQSNLIGPEIQFLITALAIELREEVSNEEMAIHLKARFEKAIKRKKIVINEIKRTGENPNKITLNDSSYYRELLNIVKDFHDITLIDWYIPIVLTFAKFVHIYVKHVEETKFCDGNFKKRSFFDFKHTEILTLIKKILNQEEQSIKEHFLNVAIGYEINDISMIKDYLRGIINNPPIKLGVDEFALAIDKHGFIQSFYQIK